MKPKPDFDAATFLFAVALSALITVTCCYVAPRIIIWFAERIGLNVVN